MQLQLYLSAQCQLEATSNKQQATSEKDRRSSCSTRCPLNPTPLQQCKVKPNTCMYSVHSKITPELTCNAQDVHGAVVVCRKQKMDQKKAKKQKRSPSHLPTCHMPYTTCSVGPISNCQLPVCMRCVCVCQPEHIDFNWSRPSFSPSLSLSLSLPLPFIFLSTVIILFDETTNWVS